MIGSDLQFTHGNDKTHKPIASVAAVSDRLAGCRFGGTIVDRTRLVGERHAAPGAAPAQSTSCR